MLHENCKSFVQTYHYNKSPKLHEIGSYIKKQYTPQSAHPLIVNELINAFNVLPSR